MTEKKRLKSLIGLLSANTTRRGRGGVGGGLGKKEKGKKKQKKLQNKSKHKNNKCFSCSLILHHAQTVCMVSKYTEEEKFKDSSV